MNTKTVFIGPDYLLRGEKAAVLNSRQSKYPVGHDPWIKATVRAIEYIQDRDWTIITSLGMNTWELVLAMASARKLKTLVVCPHDKADPETKIGDIIRRFQLEPGLTGFLFYDTPIKSRSKETWPLRDRDIVALADFLLPISIRPGGNLETLLRRHSSMIINDFAQPYLRPARQRPRYTHLCPPSDIPEEGLLVHFTRSSAAPWPDENDFHFYQAMADSEHEYCRSARATLLHILESKTIYASSRNIRDGYRVIGFTELSGDNLTRLFRYRPRLVNPYFEPYGIGISIAAAIKAGFRPVRYGPPELYQSLPPEDRPFFQNIGRNDAQWLVEKEWRHLNDLHLDRIPENSRCLLVPAEIEAELFRKRFNWRIRPLSKL